VHDKFDIRSPLEAHGIFWKPGEVKEEFTCRLARSTRGIELTSSPVLKTIDRRSVFQSSEQFIPVLHGRTTKGPCTLLALQSPVEDGLTNLDTGESLAFRQFWVGLCIVGMHIPDIAASFIQSASFSYSGLREWIPRPPGLSITPERITVELKNHPAVLDVCSLALKSRIVLDVLTGLQSFASGEQRTTREPQLVVEPAQPQSVEWLLDLANRFENLFSLLLGTSVVLRSAALNHEDETGWLLRKVHSRPEKPDPSVWVRCDSSQLTEAVLRWLLTPENFRDLETLVLWTIRKSSLFPGTEFLSLAQALESFHRLTDSTTVTQPSCFAEVLKLLRDEIKITCGESDLATRLNESIEHANEPNFRRRIESLLSRLSGDACQKLLGNPQDFERTLRQTRNYSTHIGIRKNANVLTGGREVFLFNQKLHALLRLLMLMHVGFKEDQVFDPVYLQSKKWH
jgi:ApeA N-terminal domain 1